MEPRPRTDQPPTGLALGPRSVERPADAGWTLVGGIDDDHPSRVDGGGLVNPHAADWLVDWWVGADDRWYLPAREPTIRQRRVGSGPIVETSMRVPSGDVVATAYPVLVGGQRATGVEVGNDSTVPVALAIALRPLTITGTASGPHRLERVLPTVLGMDGQPALILPRPANEAGASADEDQLDRVVAGRPLTWPDSVSGPLANAVVMFPLPHGTSLRFTVLPGGARPATTDPRRPLVLGRSAGPAGARRGIAGRPVAGLSDGGRPDAGLPDTGRPDAGLSDGGLSDGGLADALRPEALPPPDTVARGWTSVVDRAATFTFPDPGLTALAGAARARIILASGSLPDRARRLAGDAGVVLAALAAGGHGDECRPVLEALAESFPTELPDGGGPSEAAALVDAAASATELVEPALADGLLASMTQLTTLVERRHDPEATAVAQLALARLADRAGQPGAAGHLRSLVERAGPTRFGSRPAPGLDALTALAQQASPAGSWPPADDAAQAARFWSMAVALLVGRATTAAGPATIHLLPTMPSAWLGGDVEVHRAPVAGYRVSFAVRWHGYRPALLWQVEKAETGKTAETGEPAESGETAETGRGPATFRLSCPGLDPAWQTDEASGEVLLAGSPDGLPPAPAPGDSFV